MMHPSRRAYVEEAGPETTVELTRAVACRITEAST
jgi:hypothetical protein